MGPTVLDERGAFAVENPEVAEVMEIASGIISIMAKSSAPITKRRSNCGWRSAPTSSEARPTMPAHCVGCLFT